MGKLNIKGYYPPESCSDCGEISNEPNEMQLHEFAVEKFKEAIDRGLTLSEMLAELESDLLTHTPVFGKTLFDL